MSTMSTTSGGLTLVVTGSSWQRSSNLARVRMSVMTSSGLCYGWISVVNRRSSCVISMMATSNDRRRSSGETFRRPGSTISVSRSGPSGHRHRPLCSVLDFRSGSVVASWDALIED